MKTLRTHWPDAGLLLALLTIIFLLEDRHCLTPYRILMGANLASLFLHQFEEYRIPGTFPGMLNKTLYKSDLPDRYPLNTDTALKINVFIGWTTYGLAAILGEKAVWLGLASVLISAGNVVAHTVLFNLKGETFYNAGLLTCWRLLVPCIWLFFSVTRAHHLITGADYGIGIPLGIILNVVGVLRMIDWLADRNTPFIFSQRNLLQKDKKVR